MEYHSLINGLTIDKIVFEANLNKMSRLIFYSYLLFLIITLIIDAIAGAGKSTQNHDDAEYVDEMHEEQGYAHAEDNTGHDHIQRVEHTVNIHGNEHLDNLRHLEGLDLNKLKHLENLDKLKHLEGLDLDKLKHLEKLDKLDKLKHLKHLKRLSPHKQDHGEHEDGDHDGYHNANYAVEQNGDVEEQWDCAGEGDVDEGEHHEDHDLIENHQKPPRKRGRKKKKKNKGQPQQQQSGQQPFNFLNPLHMMNMATSVASSFLPPLHGQKNNGNGLFNMLPIPLPGL